MYKLIYDYSTNQSDEEAADELNNIHCDKILTRCFQVVIRYSCQIVSRIANHG